MAAYRRFTQASAGASFEVAFVLNSSRRRSARAEASASASSCRPRQHESVAARVGDARREMVKWR